MSDADVLKILRIAYHNYDKKTVAITIGVSREYLNEIERGKKPLTVSIIQKLAGLYNVSSVKLTRLFRELSDYDISKPADYQEALVKTSTFFLENQLTVN